MRLFRRRGDHDWRPISIHAPREGCDSVPGHDSHLLLAFQSTHPVRGATRDGASVTRLGRFQSTHPVRGATNAASNCSTISIISIHAPREGCDRYHRVVKLHDRISIHAPREGCDTLVGMSDRRTRQFQSTHPVRGATNAQQAERTFIEFQSTHPVRGANANTYDYNMWTPFQSTHPVRGATRLDITRRRGQRISIHAPREGCDMYIARADTDGIISIHAPREGCEPRGQHTSSPDQHFNPRTP